MTARSVRIITFGMVLTIFTGGMVGCSINPYLVELEKYRDLQMDAYILSLDTMAEQVRVERLGVERQFFAQQAESSLLIEALARQVGKTSSTLASAMVFSFNDMKFFMEGFQKGQMAALKKIEDDYAQIDVVLAEQQRNFEIIQESIARVRRERAAWSTEVGPWAVVVIGVILALAL